LFSVTVKLFFLTILLTEEAEDMKTPNSPTPKESPELPTTSYGKPAMAYTIVDWVKESYQAPPPHPSTVAVFSNLGLEYIPTFEVPADIYQPNIGKHLNDLRLEFL
jgi:hypothetical protein